MEPVKEKKSFRRRRQISNFKSLYLKSFILVILSMFLYCHVDNVYMNYVHYLEKNNTCCIWLFLKSSEFGVGLTKMAYWL
jgi:hypothetical protein